MGPGHGAERAGFREEQPKLGDPLGKLGQWSKSGHMWVGGERDAHLTFTWNLLEKPPAGMC